MMKVNQNYTEQDKKHIIHIYKAIQNFEKDKNISLDDTSRKILGSSITKEKDKQGCAIYCLKYVLPIIAQDINEKNSDEENERLGEQLYDCLKRNILSKDSLHNVILLDSRLKWKKSNDVEFSNQNQKTVASTVKPGQVYPIGTILVRRSTIHALNQNTKKLVENFNLQNKTEATQDPEIYKLNEQYQTLMLEVHDLEKEKKLREEELVSAKHTYLEKLKTYYSKLQDENQKYTLEMQNKMDETKQNKFVVGP